MPREEFEQQLCDLVDTAVEKKDAHEIAEAIYLAFVNADDVYSDVVNHALQQFEALPAALRRDVADDLESQILKVVNNIAASEQEKPMRNETPETLFALNASNVNRAISFNQLRVMKAIAKTKGADTAPLTTAVLAQTAPLLETQYLPALFYMHVTEAFNRAVTGTKAPEAGAAAKDTKDLMDKLIADGDKKAPKPQGPRP